MKGNQSSQNKFIILLDTYKHLHSLYHGSITEEKERQADINYKPKDEK